MNTADGRALITADVPLAPRTTIGVGGVARWLATVTDEAELGEALAWARDRAVPLFVLGGGSNIVVSDSGFDGLVIDVALRGIRCRERGGGVLLRVEAGESWDAVVDFAVTRGLAGVECLSGIPGRVGATPIQNVGAYGQEVAESMVEVEAVSRDDGESATFTRDECEFGYRDSVFKRREKDRWIITAVTFSLDRSRPPTVRYPELERVLAGLDAPSLRNVRDAVLGLRRAKGMVVDPADPDTRSVGSFFMNPVVDSHTFDVVAEGARSLGIPRDSIPSFPTAAGTKLSAAWLIERAGFLKGTRRGGVAISSKHALAIVNGGNATATEIRELAEEIRARVERVFGVELEPEARFVGR